MTVAALIVAAGAGTRTGSLLPKQFALLAGKSLIAHSVDNFAEHRDTSHIFVVIGAGQEVYLSEALGNESRYHAVIGGKERQDSVQAGLEAIAAFGGIEKVLIHDAARPVVPHEIIDRLLAALTEAQAAVPALAVVDTLARAHDWLGDVVDRAGLVHVQTPQAFHLDTILAAHARWDGGSASDDAQMVRDLGIEVALVDGDARLAKITYPGDLERMEAMLLAQSISRTGMGFDVHAFAADRDLWLCGVKIEHDQGLAGHSDADVALHALTDAILGAIAEGDIGSHFPPSDPQWRGATSDQFLIHACELVKSKGGVIDHVDVTIICEAPKIGPYRNAMRTRVAALLQVQLDRVSIKATTTEQLGFTGRGEGIAAQAIASVRVPM